MKFCLVDKIESLAPGERIVAVKNLSLAEEYLADHFPAFPVLPGVLMLEALTQSAAWLTRVQQDFSKSLVLLSAARNVRYASFVAPGHTLRCEVDAVKIDSDGAKFKAVGFVGDIQAVSARLELQCRNLADERPSMADTDDLLRRQARELFGLIGGPRALAAETA